MIKFEDIEVSGIRNATKAMRNPLNSWHKSDSGYEEYVTIDGDLIQGGKQFVIGKNDLDLMQRLYKAGPEHRKFMRQMFISVTITAPMYFWKQASTYSVGVTMNSCSTMHTIHKETLTLDHFSYDNMDELGVGVLETIIKVLNQYVELYNETNDKTYWFNIIKLLPDSFNQKRTVTLNYEVAVNIIHQRMNHKLPEWNEVCRMLLCLPYMKDITGLEYENQ